ncbi:MBOAT family O-acyltransferase [Horticoccus sp. 23ND18S-11]|uniref:MBOAT family O-acyltransferase n=1 Tax=Horticoccus sp. 23ND18S-11 TaxID=3391832 RepID=UPI0039C95154
MVFNSFEFALFFPIVCALYFTLPLRWRTPLLLVASCGFYMAFIPVYILVLGLTIVIDYTAGLYLEHARGRRRKLLLAVSIVATCLVLFVFKYFNFFAGSLTGFAQVLGWELKNPSLALILPIGLSFHTFQSLSYVVEVYRGHQPAERNVVVYATYVMFFPQLVAGPIERPQSLLHQFRERHDYDYARIVSGLKRMAWGLFKKLVIADRVAFYVNDVYAAPQNFNGLQLTVATVFFAYQIYCDFSGYSDIAIGSARVLGFTLRENFDRPYAATSLGDFWRRWHLSLSTWFRDYVYIPLGGSQVGPWRWARNILVTFGLSGLWHGANWTYVVWGLMNGVGLIAGRVTQPLRDRVLGAVGLRAGTAPRRLIQTVSTLVLIGAGWVVFRANSLTDAWHILTHWPFGWNPGAIITERFYLKHFPPALLAIVTLELIQFLNTRRSVGERVARLPLGLRWPAYAGFALLMIFFGVFSSNQFIYFQF